MPIIKSCSVLSVSVDDFKSIGYDASSLTQEALERVADQLASSFLESGAFWDTLESLADDLHLPAADHE